jgi:hypothetical protein
MDSGSTMFDASDRLNAPPKRKDNRKPSLSSIGEEKMTKKFLNPSKQMEEKN